MSDHDYDHIVNEMGDVRRYLSEWKASVHSVLEDGTEEDLRITLRLTLQWLEEMTDLALITFAEMIAVGMGREGFEVPDSVPDVDSTDT